MVEPVIYGNGTPAEHQTVLPSHLPFGTTVKALEAAIAAEDLWVIHTIDPQVLMSKAGLRIDRARQILFFHPRFMSRLLSTNPSAIVEAPLKFVVLEFPGGEVVVYAPSPDAALARYLGQDALGRNLAAVCGAIVDRWKNTRPSPA